MWDAESANLTVKFEVPAAEGVPVTAPVEELRLSPAGSAPLEIDQVNGAVPSTALSDEL